MKITKSGARALCTATEFDVVSASFAPDVRSLTAARLKANIALARRYLDKYRDLARRQHRAVQTKQAKIGQTQQRGNIRTELKARLFAETQSRFEKALEQLEVRELRKRMAAARAAAKTRDRVKRAADKETAAKHVARRRQERRTTVADASRETRARRQFQKTRLTTIHAHLRARGRRHQARRDSR
jgi:hypothetical protein